MKLYDWTDAISKLSSEGQCRVCGRSDVKLEAAHTAGRKYDDRKGNSQTTHKVERVATVPLCKSCHMKFDARALDLLPYLDQAEQAYVVFRMGIVRAYERLTGERIG